MLRRPRERVISARTAAAGLRQSTAGAGFSRRWTDRYRDAHGEIARREFGAGHVFAGQFDLRRVGRRRRRPAGPTIYRGFRPRDAHFVGFLAGADGPWPCALRLCGLGHVRGRCAGPPRWGGSRIGGSVGLLWVHDAGPRGLNAASRSANQTSTPLGAIAAHRSRYSRYSECLYQPADPPNRDQTCR